MLLLRLLVLPLVHRLLWAAAGEDSSASLVKPGCPDKCGAVTIPYPFGIGDGCYRQDPYSNQSFLVTCNYSYVPPQPFLGRGNIKAFEVSLEKVVIQNIIAAICYNQSVGIAFQFEPSIRLRSSQYIFSDVNNRFVVLGCNIQAAITDNSSFTSGCRTYCSSEVSMKNGSCDGIGCCQASIPKSLRWQYYKISILPTMDNNNSNSWSFAPCGYAFLADKDRFNFSVNDLLDPDFFYKMTYDVPVALDWAVGNETCEEAREKPNFACGGNATCTNSTYGPGYRCSCLPGYHGNPYLPQGCQDIDECEDSKANSCTDICVNLAGGYKCSCPEGSYGDGRKDGHGCNEKGKSFQATKTILGVGLGLALLLLVVSWLYWALKQRRLMKLREKSFEQNGGLMLQ